MSNKPAITLNQKDWLQQDAFELLKKTVDKKQGWWFGGFSYDLKNQIEKLSSTNFDGLHMPELFFFNPKYFLSKKKVNGQLKFLIKD